MLGYQHTWADELSNFSVSLSWWMLTSAVLHYKYNVLIVTTLLLLLLESKYSHMRKFQNSDWPKEGCDPQYAKEMFRL